MMRATVVLLVALVHVARQSGAVVLPTLVQPKRSDLQKKLELVLKYYFKKYKIKKFPASWSLWWDRQHQNVSLPMKGGHRIMRYKIWGSGTQTLMGGPPTWLCFYFPSLN
jgi:hypothetical protein